MASTVVNTRDMSGLPGGSERQILVALNLLAVAMDTLCAKLDADAGVTDVNYTTLVANTCQRIANQTGTFVTA